MDSGQNLAQQGVHSLRKAFPVQRHLEHGTPGAGPGRGKRHLILAVNTHRHLFQHRQAAQQRHLRQGIRQAAADSPAEDPGTHPGDPAPGGHCGQQAAVPGICPEQHTFSQGYKKPGSGPVPSEIRGAVLPAAVPAAAEERKDERLVRHTFPKSRRGIQLVLQPPAL